MLTNRNHVLRRGLAAVALGDNVAAVERQHCNGGHFATETDGFPYLFSDVERPHFPLHQVGDLALRPKRAEGAVLVHEDRHHVVGPNERRQLLVREMFGKVHGAQPPHDLVAQGDFAD